MSVPSQKVVALDDSIVQLGKDLNAAVDPGSASKWSDDWGLVVRWSDLLVKWKVWLAAYQQGKPVQDGDFNALRMKYNLLRSDFLSKGGATSVEALGGGSDNGSEGGDHTGLFIIGALALATYLVVKR